VADRTLTGEFTVEDGIIDGDRLVANVGFLAGTSGTVTFTVFADGVEPKVVEDSAGDGILRPIALDLTRASGQTSVTIKVTASVSPTPTPSTTDAPSDSPAVGQYAAVWKNLQIVGPTE
jgi:hypothetical protein